MKAMDGKMHAADRRLLERETKIEETQRYSRRWNSKLVNLPEATNETTEDTRKQVFNILGHIAPDDGNRMGFLIDTVHRIGRPREGKSARPVIIQFTMRTFRQKIWKESLSVQVMKERKLRFAEDLTYREKQCRKKLWPLVEKARKEGKKTSWRGPDVIIDGRRMTAETIKDTV